MCAASDRGGRTLPIVCLPGLTRNGARFRYAGDRAGSDAAAPRRVLTIDSRGRGRSDYDRDPDNYDLPIELADVLAVLTALEIRPAIFLGTSRGGILSMLLGTRPARRDRRRDPERHRPGDRAQGPGAAQGLCRQDAAPRAASPRAPRSCAGSATPVHRLTARAVARRGAAHLGKQVNGGLVLDYDARLARTLESVDLERPLPPLWGPFDSLAQHSADGGARRQFGHPVGRDDRCHAGTPARISICRGAGSGPRAAPGRGGRDRADRRDSSPCATCPRSGSELVRPDHA